ncbi:MAG: leucine-rich repeat domain-containing protein, partial [Bacteroidota bacterium]
MTNVSPSTIEKVELFRRRFEQLGYGEGHFIFACHGAFPIGLTADLLYQLWANFKDYKTKSGQQKSIDVIAVSDLILSGLCRPTRQDIFEMDTETRAHLLNLLRADERFGEVRLQLLASFLYQYMEEVGRSRFTPAFVEAQQWTAMATMAPNAAATQISKALSQHIEANASGEIIRMRNLLESYSNQDQGFESMLHYAQGLKAALFEMPAETVEAEFNEALQLSMGDEDADGKVVLEIPMLKKLKGKIKLQKPKEETLPDSVSERIEAMLAAGSTELDLSKMHLAQIPPEVLELRQLTKLDLFVNGISRIPVEIAQLENLEELLMSVNPLSRVPDSLAELKKLRRVKFDDCKLDDFPSVLLELKGLQNISLENNNIAFCPPEVATLPELRLLDLRGNPVFNLPEAKLKATGSYFRRYFEGLSPNKSAPQIALILAPAEKAEQAESIKARTYHPLEEAEQQGQFQVLRPISYNALDIYRTSR